MYYTTFPSRERGRKHWWAICKIKSRAVHYMLEKKEPQLSEYFQKDETLGFHWFSIDAELDAPGIFIHDGQYEKVDPTNFILKDNPIQEREDEEEEELEEEEEVEDGKVEEEKKLKEESEGYQTSEEANE